MPKVSTFFGISVYIYYRDHNPPHFHARHGGREVQLRIEDLSVLNGGLEPKAMGILMEWAVLRKQALIEAWNRAKRYAPIGMIEPLK